MLFLFSSDYQHLAEAVFFIWSYFELLVDMLTV